MSTWSKVRQAVMGAVPTVRLSPARPEYLPPSSPPGYLVEPLEQRTMLNAGGGWTGGGIPGAYYPNGSFSGNPSFTRTDVRIDFTPTSAAPGGSIDPAFGAIATASTWSVYWDATVIPKYTETYTFKEMIGSGDSGTVYFGTGAQGHNPTILSGSGTQTVTENLVAGQTYNLQLNYVHNGGSTWQAQLHWLSTGAHPFPEEAIEPATPVGADLGQPTSTDFANLTGFFGQGYGHSTLNGPGPALDANGWPTADFGFIGNSEVPTPGIYTVTFTGAAQLETSAAAPVEFLVGYNSGVDSRTGNTSSGSATITSLSSTSNLFAGETVTGSGIPSGDTITAVGSGTVTLGTAATATTSSDALTVSLVVSGKTYYAYNAAGAYSVSVPFAALQWNSTTGTGFNPSNGTTTVLYDDPEAALSTLDMGFVNTSRNGYGAPGGPTATTGAGLTNVQLLAPTTFDGPASYAPGLVFSTPFLQAQSPLTVMRVVEFGDPWNELDTTAAVAGTDWNDRLLPDGIWLSNTNITNSNGQVPWEYEVMLANETGKDLYINLPFSASPSYMSSLANLIKNGDTVSGVVYPGLLPNLNIYIEYGDETWNYQLSGPDGDFGNIADIVMPANETANTAEWQAYVAMGGSTSSPNVEDWTVLQDYEASTAFRAVYGNSAMPSSTNGVPDADPRVRPVYEWQGNGADGYDGGEGVTGPLTMVDSHFGVQANYYLYGGGGAWYADDSDDASTVNQLFADATTIEATPEGTATSYTGIPGNYADINGYAPGTNVTTGVEWDAGTCQAFGLKDVGYEGGFDFGGPLATATGETATLDPRMAGLVQESIGQFYQGGGTLPIVFQETDRYDNPAGGGQGWAVINGIWDQTGPGGTAAGYLSADPPKLQGYVNATQSLPPNTALPAGWTYTAVGATATYGSITTVGGMANYNNATGTFTVIGFNPHNTAFLGNAGVTSDQYNAETTQVSGSATITAEVTAGNNAGGALAMRTSPTDPSAPCVFLFNYNGDWYLDWRTTEGGVLANYQDQSTAAGPWMKLVESGDVFTGYVSSNDGTGNWTAVGSVTMTTTNFPTTSFAAGLAMDTNGGHPTSSWPDSSSWVSFQDVAINGASVDAIADGGFNNPVISAGGNGAYNPTGTPWTFAGGAGLASDGSNWGFPTAPNGYGVAAFLQETGAISQELDIPAPGIYAVSFDAVRRSNYGGINPIQFSVAGTNVGSTLTPASGSTWTSYTTGAFSISAAGDYTIEFAGTNGTTDSTSAISSLLLSSAYGTAVAIPAPASGNGVIAAVQFNTGGAVETAAFTSPIDGSTGSFTSVTVPGSGSNYSDGPFSVTGLNTAYVPSGTLTFTENGAQVSQTNNGTSNMAGPFAALYADSISFGAGNFTISGLNPNSSYGIAIQACDSNFTGRGAHFSLTTGTNAGLTLTSPGDNGETVDPSYSPFTSVAAVEFDNTVSGSNFATTDASGNLTFHVTQTGFANGWMNGFELYAANPPPPVIAAVQFNTGGAVETAAFTSPIDGSTGSFTSVTVPGSGSNYSDGPFSVTGLNTAYVPSGTLTFSENGAQVSQTNNGTSNMAGPFAALYADSISFGAGNFTISGLNPNSSYGIAIQACDSNFTGRGAHFSLTTGTNAGLTLTSPGDNGETVDPSYSPFTSVAAVEFDNTVSGSNFATTDASGNLTFHVTQTGFANGWMNGFELYATS